MVEDGAFDYPTQDARKLSSEFHRQVLVDLCIRYLDLERYALKAIPNRVVRVRDHRPVVAVEEQFVCWLEGDHVLAETPCFDLSKPGQVFHSAERQTLPLLNFAGRDEPGAWEIRNVRVDGVVRHRLLRANHEAVDLNLPSIFLVAKRVSDDLEERRLAVVALT